jgi:serine/threonine protein kinase
MEGSPSQEDLRVILEGDAPPRTRPELLQQMLRRETAETTRTEEFHQKVLTPILAYIRSHPEIEETLGDAIDLFEQYSQLIEARREYVHGLEDNCTPENITSPLTTWVTQVPRLLHFFALAFHHFHLYRDPFVRVCDENPELAELVRKCEEEYGVALLRVLKDDTEYPSRLLPIYTLLDQLTDHAVAAPGSKTIVRKKVDEVKTSALISQVHATWQKCRAAKADEIPDMITATLKLIPSPRFSSYGKNVIIHELKKDKDKENNEIIVVGAQMKGKVISKISDHSQAHFAEITNEIEANRRLHHQNVLRMQKYMADEVFHYLIFPNTEKEDLREVLHKVGFLCEEAARPIFRELVLGVQHMHSNGIVHGQVSPPCILFYKDHVRLSDFSLCSLATRGEKKSVKRGPFVYMAPESFKEGAFDGALNDIWSCGIILYELLVGATPYANTPKKSFMQQVKRGTIVYPKKFSSSVIFLLKGILDPQPSERFSIEQILSHPWMLKTREVPISSTLRPQDAVKKKKAVQAET